ncbi:MAG: phytanoyl-CoA dioxygenase family protein [Caldilineaceae bacterium]
MTTTAFPDLQRTLQFYPVANAQPRLLTPQQIQQYNAKGYIFPLDVLTPAEVAHHRAYFEALMAKAAAAGWNSYSINGWQTRCAGIYDLVTHPRVLDYVQDLLGENLVCWATHYFAKMPGDGKRVSWHQDASYWPLTPSKTVTVWLAIDDVDVENGAMQVIPGSHVHGQLDFEEAGAEENSVLSQSVRSPESYGEAPVAFEMKAGQISLHTDLLLHGSEPNLSNRRRCGLTMRFVSPDVRELKGWRRNSIIARGSDPSGHWPHNPRPAGDDIPTPETKIF